MVVLDTSFIIDLIRNNSEAVRISEGLDSNEVSIATPTIVELVRGLESKNVRSYEKEKVFELIDNFKILDLDKDCAILAGEIEDNLRKTGDRIDVIDIMIGAIAIENNEILLTRNLNHFQRIEKLKCEGY